MELKKIEFKTKTGFPKDGYFTLDGKVIDVIPISNPRVVKMRSNETLLAAMHGVPSGADCYCASGREQINDDLYVAVQAVQFCYMNYSPKKETKRKTKS
jgi:hypothetical protein